MITEPGKDSKNSRPRFTVTVGIPLGFAALVFGILALAGSTSSTRHSMAPPTTLATPTPAPSVPPIADLTPELSHTPLEGTPEIQALRHASTALAWAVLHGSCDFPDARQWLHPEILKSPTHGLCWPIRHLGTGVGQAGPDAFEPLEIIHHDDGTVDVLACQVDQPFSRFDLRTHEPAARALTGHSLTIRRLIPTERGYQLIPGPHSGPIQECEPREPITTQVFVDWQHTPLFTAFAETATRGS